LDTAPNNEEGIDLELRKAQIELRKAEIKEVKRILEIIHDGNGRLIAAQNLRNESAKSGNSRGLDGIDWESWKGRFHLKQATMMGHSFGAATAIQVLRDNDQFPDFSQGIALDPWAAVIPPAEGNTIRVPLLIMNSEAFMWWSDNFKAAKRVADEAGRDGNLSWLLTIAGSIHLSQTDIPILYPRVCSILLKMTADPKRAISLTLNAALEFLKNVMPRRLSAMNRGKDEGLLKVSITQEMPEEHRPDNRWIGMRLKIPHELATRVRNRKKRGKGSKFPEPEEEVWMHVAPSIEDIKAYTVPDDVLD
jgi:platelet-activating factor acetylhydrolase